MGDSRYMNEEEWNHITNHVGFRKSGYHADRALKGENVELLELAASTGSFVTFILSKNRPPLHGKVLMFNNFTGRVFVDRHETVDNFLIKDIVAFQFPKALYTEWIKRKGVNQ